MNFLFVISATIALIAVPACFFLFISAERYRRRLRSIELQLTSVTMKSGSLEKDAEDIKILREQNGQFIEQKSIAITQRDGMEKQMKEAQAERTAFLLQKEEAIAARLMAEKKCELMQHNMLAAEKRMQDWETQRAESLQAAKASILEAGGQLSSKLLEDHKRENEAAKKLSEENAKKNSEMLLEQVKTVAESVAALKEQTHETREKMASVWQALTTPAGAGYLAEVGLENSLKNLGLEPMRDYIMQYAFVSGEGNSLRPDAVIFLPQDMVMVIDSKASKFLMEVAEAENSITEKEALEKLKKTMNDHLKALISKDYRAAITSFARDGGRSQKLKAIFNVMYLPSDNALGMIKRADPEFAIKAEKAGLILAGPASLVGLLSLAHLNIGIGRQAENQEAIVENVQELVNQVVVVLTYADKIGRGIKSAAENMDKFARSVNGRLLPKMRQLAGLGIKTKNIPASIATYDIRVSNEMLTIEGDVETATEHEVIDLPRIKESAA